MFASAPADAALLAVTTPLPRYPELVTLEVTATWRVDFRASGVSGAALAANAMSKAMLYRRTLLDPPMIALGFQPAGTPLSEPSVPVERDESLAVLDVAFIGILTGAVAKFAMRAIGVTQTAQAA